jgi:hypothetical protein
MALGAFGIVELAPIMCTLRQYSSDAHWLGIEMHLKVTFRDRAIGLAMMLLPRFYPSRTLQL